MFEKLLRGLLAVSIWLPIAAAAAVEVNKGDQADLESVKGIGPQLAGRILAERGKAGPYKDWIDLIARVKGVTDRNAASLSAAGLRVNGKPDPFDPPPPRPRRHPAPAGSAASAN